MERLLLSGVGNTTCKLERPGKKIHQPKLKRHAKPIVPPDSNLEEGLHVLQFPLLNLVVTACAWRQVSALTSHAVSSSQTWNSK